MSPTVQELRNEIRVTTGRFVREVKASFTKEELRAICEALGIDVGAAGRPSKSQMRRLIRAHVDGECTHEVDVPPREPTDRSQDITVTECQTIRETYRASPDTEFADIAEEYDCSPTTIERHVTFRCSHPPVDALVTNVEAVQDILESGVEEDDGLSKLSSAEIVRLESAENADRQEPARDLGTPDPERVETTRSWVIRNTDLAHDMKRMYDHTCQICGASR